MFTFINITWTISKREKGYTILFESNFLMPILINRNNREKNHKSRFFIGYLFQHCINVEKGISESIVFADA